MAIDITLSLPLEIHTLPLEVSTQEFLSSFTYQDLRNFQLVSKDTDAFIRFASTVHQDDIDLSGKQIQRIPGSAPAFIRQRFRTDTLASHPSWLKFVHDIQKEVSEAKADSNDPQALVEYSIDKTTPDNQLYQLLGILILFSDTGKCTYEHPNTLAKVLKELVIQENSFELAQAVFSHPRAHEIYLHELEWTLERISRSCGKEVFGSVKLLKLLFAQSNAANISAEGFRLAAAEGVRRRNAEFVRVLFTHPNLRQFPTTGELSPGHVFVLPSPIKLAVALEPPFNTIIGALQPELRAARDLESALAIAKNNDDPETQQVILSHPNAAPLKKGSCTIL